VRLLETTEYVPTVKWVGIEKGKGAIDRHLGVTLYRVFSGSIYKGFKRGHTSSSKGGGATSFRREEAGGKGCETGGKSLNCKEKKETGWSRPCGAMGRNHTDGVRKNISLTDKDWKRGEAVKRKVGDYCSGIRDSACVRKTDFGW